MIDDREILASDTWSIFLPTVTARWTALLGVVLSHRKCLSIRMLRIKNQESGSKFVFFVNRFQTRPTLSFGYFDHLDLL